MYRHFPVLSRLLLLGCLVTYPIHTSEASLCGEMDFFISPVEREYLEKYYNDMVEYFFDPFPSRWSKYLGNREILQMSAEKNLRNFSDLLNPLIEQLSRKDGVVVSMYRLYQSAFVLACNQPEAKAEISALAQSVLKTEREFFSRSLTRQTFHSRAKTILLAPEPETEVQRMWLRILFDLEPGIYPSSTLRRKLKCFVKKNHIDAEEAENLSHFMDHGYSRRSVRFGGWSSGFNSSH